MIIIKMGKINKTGKQSKTKKCQKRAVMKDNMSYSRGGISPDVGVSLHIEVVKVVGTLSSTKVWSLQPLDDLSFHHSGNVSR